MTRGIFSFRDTIDHFSLESRESSEHRVQTRSPGVVVLCLPLMASIIRLNDQVPGQTQWFNREFGSCLLLCVVKEQIGCSYSILIWFQSFHLLLILFCVQCLNSMKCKYYMSNKEGVSGICLKGLMMYFTKHALFPDVNVSIWNLFLVLEVTQYYEIHYYNRIYIYLIYRTV